MVWKMWLKLVEGLTSPKDPSSLAVFRILFGFSMLLDIFHERGLHVVHELYYDPELCRFPLFDWLTALPLKWMYGVYFILFLGAVGIMLGLFFKISCIMFLISYWYLFLLDKTTWNNHSYLYGLCSYLMLLSNANACWSLDISFRKKPTKQQDVPSWQYAVFQAQFFLVYFIAGLKKLDKDWVGGYAMNSLGNHWVFAPLKLFLPVEVIDLLVVHHGGLFVDLFTGIFLLTDYFKPLGVILSTAFHVMNAQMFQIGMFPYVMLSTTLMFFAPNWPKVLLRNIFGNKCLESTGKSKLCFYKPVQAAEHSITKASSTKEETSGTESSHSVITKPTSRHHAAAVFVISYVTLQGFIPYSHFLTLGYNNWTQGLYGYSWDMMVHSWSTQHVRITLMDGVTGETQYINPQAWTKASLRWTAHADMAKQLATCVRGRLKKLGYKQPKLYFDVWRSLNDRFQQRLFDPNVDLVQASWDALQQTAWVMPLLTSLSNWRQRMDEIERDMYEANKYTSIVFIADFPGLVLENYVQPDLGNTSLHVLNGTVTVKQTGALEGVTLNKGDQIQLAAGTFHEVHTVSSVPSCYMYVFVNTTEESLVQQIKRLEDQPHGISKIKSDPKLRAAYEDIQHSKTKLEQPSVDLWMSSIKKFFVNKFTHFHKGWTMMCVGVWSIITNQELETVFNTTLLQETISF